MVREGFIKEGAGILHQIYRFRGDFSKGSSIHKSKSWYYLGLFQIYKVELFANIVFGYKPITLVVKRAT